MSLVLHEDPLRGGRLEVPLPLTFEADIQAMAQGLSLPAYLDLTNFQIRKAVVTLWATTQADSLADSRSDKPYSRQPIPVALFGGMAFRMLCPSTNDPAGPFFRPLNDLDLIVPRRDGRSFIALLTDLSARFGTGYGYWITKPDKTYNGFREGRRYRLMIWTRRVSRCRASWISSQRTSGSVMRWISAGTCNLPNTITLHSA